MGGCYCVEDRDFGAGIQPLNRLYGSAVMYSMLAESPTTPTATAKRRGLTTTAAEGRGSQSAEIKTKTHLIS